MATSRDDTFRNFTASQAAAYATFRGASYPPVLYETVLSYVGSRRNIVYDVGTGPGKIVFDLLPHFQRGIGCDSSAAMIAQAKKDAEARGLADRSLFLSSNAEECADKLAPEDQGAVDLLTVGMAVHWFDLPRFYAQAAKALAGGGVLAVWSNSGMYCHPSDPKHKEIQALLNEFMHSPELVKHMTPGNLLNRDRLRGLTMPWNIEETKGLFDESEFRRVEWDVDGVPSAPDLPDGTPGPFLRSEETDIDLIEAGMESASPVTRWRQANPDKARTDQDLIRIMVTKLRAILGDRKTIKGGSTVTLLLFRKAKKTV